MGIVLLIYLGFATIVVAMVSFLIALAGWLERHNSKDMLSMVGWAIAFVWSIIATYLMY